MSRYLIQTTEIYRADSEIEAQEIIGAAKAAAEYTLTKYSSEKKEVKARGKSEVVDEYYKISLTKVFTDIKEPEVQVDVIYEI
jgi:hypothetical protein